MHLRVYIRREAVELDKHGVEIAIQEILEEMPSGLGC
jgi:hypothetical protein